MPEVFLVSGARTAQGRYGGRLASVRPDGLAALTVGEVVRRSGVPGRLERGDLRRGLATLCVGVGVGVGQGMAMLSERP